jgi:hypothetical protein
LDFLVGEAVVKRRGFLLVPNLAATNSIAETAVVSSRIAIAASCNHSRSRFAIQLPNQFQRLSGSWAEALVPYCTESRHCGTETKTI